MTHTDAQLRAMLERAEKATEGPWTACVWDPMERPHVHKDMPSQTRCSPPDLPLTRDDADFIAHAREDLPAVTRELLEARALLARTMHYHTKGNCDYCDETDRLIRAFLEADDD